MILIKLIKYSSVDLQTLIFDVYTRFNNDKTNSNNTCTLFMSNTSQ